MIDFALPWMFLLLPLPWLAWRLLPPAREGRGGALRVPFFATLVRSTGRDARLGWHGRCVAVAKLLIWVLLVFAASQPRWIGEPRSLATHGRDLMLAIDLSGSMASEDFDVQGRPVDRLAVVSAVAREFVAQRRGDRVGLVLFGSRAYLQAPLTTDRETLIEMLDESEVGLAGEETAIGDAVGLAVKYLRDRPAEERVLVLLSDGASNSGVLEPLQAAQIAAEENVRIHTIGIGSGQQVVKTPLGRRMLPAPAELDESTLAGMAEITGGSYFRARDTAGLLEVYRQIDALEPSEGEGATLRPSRALFHWPLSLALALAAALLLARLAREAGDLLRRPEEGMAS